LSDANYLQPQKLVVNIDQIPAVQQQLQAVAGSRPVQLGPYLSKLCEALSHSMIGDNRSISLNVHGGEGSASCRDAESFGLIVTELVINSVKHAFSEDTKDGRITVEFDVSGTDWKVSVVDNGIGKPNEVFAQPKTGLGTGIVNALAKQLDAKVETLSGLGGTSVSVTRATFAAKKIELPERSLREEVDQRGALGPGGRDMDRRPGASI
jgi:chemotaxis protein methyltransferase CheR